MASRTFAQLKVEVLSNIDEASDTDTSEALVEYYLRQAHEQRCTQHPWPWMLWPTIETFSTVASQKSYALHQEFLTPLYFKNRTTNAYLTEVPFRSLQETGANWTADTGSIDRFYLQGFTPVLRQPTSASAVSIVSSSAADSTAAKAITIYGDTADGMTSETLTPNGTTTVTGTTSFTTITEVSKGAAWAGTATVSYGATTALTLFANELSRQYPQLFSLRLPSSVEVVEYRFYRKPRTLSADSDIPNIPAPFDAILVWDALLMMAAYLPEASGSMTAAWANNAARLEAQMYDTFQEAQSINAMGTFIRDPYGFR